MDTLFRHDLSVPYDMSQPLLPQIKSLPDTPFIYADNVAKLNQASKQMAKELEKYPLIAVDLEFSHCRYEVNKKQRESHVIAVIQISTVESDYIFDVFHLRDEFRKTEDNFLREVFADTRVTKIMHGCDNDLRLLVCDLGFVTQAVFDTAIAFSFI